MDQKAVLVIIGVIIVFIFVFSFKRKQREGVTSRKDIEELYWNGQPVVAEVKEIKTIVKNNMTYYDICSQWKRPGTNRKYNYVSEAYQNNRALYVDGSYVYAHIDPGNPRRYFIDPSRPPLLIGYFAINHPTGVANARDVAELVESGRSESARVMSVHAKKIGSMTYYYVMARQSQPQPNQRGLFYSGLFSFDPAQYVLGTTVSMKIDPRNSRRYYIDLYNQL